jgi:hypothetical protein
MKALFATVTVFAAALVQAHDGHGLAAEHWHATDAWGFLLIGVVIALWIRRGK